MSLGRSQINDYLTKINIHDKTVADVGVQDNPATNYVRGTPKSVTTFDIDPEWKPDHIYDLNKPNGGLDKALGTYDVVFCLEVLEHVYDPIQAVKNLAYLTHTGSKVYISTPFLQVLHDKWDMLRFTYQWFEVVLPKHGFKDIVVTQRIATQGQKELEKFYKAEGIRMSRVTQKMGLTNHYYDIGYIVEATRT